MSVYYLKSIHALAIIHNKSVSILCYESINQLQMLIVNILLTNDSSDTSNE